MSKTSIGPKHHRNISIIDSFSNESGFNLNQVSKDVGLDIQVIPEDEVSVLMNSIQSHKSKRELSQHDQKLNIRKKVLKLYQQSKSIKPKVKLLNIPKCRNSINKEKLFVPVLSSRRNNRSPLPAGYLTQGSKRSDSSVRSGKSHTNSINISPSSSRRLHPELSYLV
jgi:hypothetical protein